MAKIVLETGPTERVLDVDDLKTHAKIETSQEETYLATLIDAASEAAESFTWRRFVTQTWDEYFDGFADPLKLRYPPLSSVSQVTYVDTNGDTQTLATSVWEYGSLDGIGVLRRKYNQVWPSTRGHEDVVIVRFICGYGAAAVVPERIKQAIRLHAAWFFRNREGQPLPEAFYNVLWPYRVARPQAIGAAE